MGLPTAILFAESGHTIVGIDSNEELVKDLKNQTFEHEEKDVNSMLKRVTADGRLTFSHEVSAADLHVICVPTPFKKTVDDEASADMTMVWSVVQSICDVMTDQSAIVIESTCPIGTSKAISEYVFSRLGYEITVGYSPERVLPGSTLNELRSNYRLVGLPPSGKYRDLIIKLYCDVCDSSKVSVCLPEEAELAKLMENAFRFVNIGFANEMADLIRSYNLSPSRLIQLANLHPRVSILEPGIGVGGHCIPVDPLFLVSNQQKTPITIKTAVQINEQTKSQVSQVIQKKITAYQPSRINWYGLAYKPNVGDFRESPSLQILREVALLNPSIDFYVYEPFFKGQLASLKLGPNVRLGSFNDEPLGSYYVVAVNHDYFESCFNGIPIFDVRSW